MQPWRNFLPRQPGAVFITPRTDLSYSETLEYQENLSFVEKVFPWNINPEVHDFLARLMIAWPRSVCAWSLMRIIAEHHLPHPFAKTPPRQDYDIAWESFWCLLRSLGPIDAPQAIEPHLINKALSSINAIFVAVMVAAMGLEDYQDKYMSMCIGELLTKDRINWWLSFVGTIAMDVSRADFHTDILPEDLLEYLPKECFVEHPLSVISRTFTTKFGFGTDLFACPRAFDLFPDSFVSMVLPCAEYFPNTCLLTQVCRRLITSNEDIQPNVELLKYFIGRMPKNFFGEIVFLGDYKRIVRGRPSYSRKNRGKRIAGMLLILLKACNDALQHGASGKTDHGFEPDEAKRFFSNQARVVITVLLEAAFSDKHLFATKTVIGTEGSFYSRQAGWETFTPRQMLDRFFPGEFLEYVPE